jgi:hypothetical protein
MLSRNTELANQLRLLSANPLDDLAEMNECGLILPKIHLQPLAIGVEWP